jgi:hypothetical protein
MLMDSDSVDTPSKVYSSVVYSPPDSG